VLAAFLASTRPWFKLQYHKKKKRKGTTSTLKNAWQIVHAYMLAKYLGLNEYAHIIFILGPRREEQLFSSLITPGVCCLTVVNTVIVDCISSALPGGFCCSMKCPWTLKALYSFRKYTGRQNKLRSFCNLPWKQRRWGLSLRF
jgi:hypothetical protein